MRAKRQTKVIITVEHDEVGMLRNALRAFVSTTTERLVELYPGGEATIEDFDQHGLVRRLIDLLTEEE